MKTVLSTLEERVSAAMGEVARGERCAAIVRPAAEAKFGDYQANGAMALAKRLKRNPREVAQEVVSRLDVSGICEAPEIAGPGFINLRVKADFVAGRLLTIREDAERLGIDRAETPQTVVVDFSSPNIAKQMHVGHLRSTIIGDCICRVLECLGHKVIRQSHVGDWGTQFGMLINFLVHRRVGAGMGAPVDQVGDMEDFYRQAKLLDDSDPEFAKTSRDCVVGLQRGDQDMVAFWRDVVRYSLDEAQAMYDRLRVDLTRNDVRGESFYNDRLPDVVEELKKQGLGVESDGAVCVFPEGFKNREGERLPFIIQKRDGAYLYATTDLAALRYRVNELKADKVVYVTDARQSLHFATLFKVAEMAGWDRRDGKKIDLVHVTFGSVLGANGKPLKTREGENVKLKELLDEAVERAKAVVEQKNPGLADDEKQRIARAVGIGAVKYADYSNNRDSDYVFSFDKMLSLDGNTAPYMQYAYARIRSIERKAQDRGIDVAGELAGLGGLNLIERSELDLAKHLIRYGEAVEAGAADYRPNYLTSYLYELAQNFSVFYTNCPVLDAGPQSRPTRLLLCDLTARTIKHGLSSLLRIEVVEQM